MLPKKIMWQISEKNWMPNGKKNGKKNLNVEKKNENICEVS